MSRSSSKLWKQCHLQLLRNCNKWVTKVSTLRLHSLSREVNWWQTSKSKVFLLLQLHSGIDLNRFIQHSLKHHNRVNQNNKMLMNAWVWFYKISEHLCKKQITMKIWLQIFLSSRWSVQANVLNHLRSHPPNSLRRFLNSAAILIMKAIQSINYQMVWRILWRDKLKSTLHLWTGMPSMKKSRRSIDYRNT